MAKKILPTKIFTAKLIPLTKLKQDPSNVRLHPKENIEAIKKSLTRFGQTKNIVALPNGVIVAGNGTFIGAKELGWPSLAVVTIDSEKEARAYGLADNQTALTSEWDWAGLGAMLKELSAGGEDLFDLGFPQHDIDNLLSAEFSAGQIKEDELGLPAITHKYIFTEEQNEIIQKAISNLNEGLKKDFTDEEAITKICEKF